MAKKHLNDCRSGHDLIQYAECHGAEVFHNSTSHVKVRTKLGMVPIPDHRSDMGTGLRCKIIKTLLAIGIAVVLIEAIVPEAVLGQLISFVGGR